MFMSGHSALAIVHTLALDSSMRNLAFVHAPVFGFLANDTQLARTSNVPMFFGRYILPFERTLERTLFTSETSSMFPRLFEREVYDLSQTSPVPQNVQRRHERVVGVRVKGQQQKLLLIFYTHLKIYVSNLIP